MLLGLRYEMLEHDFEALVAFTSVGLAANCKSIYPPV